MSFSRLEMLEKFYVEDPNDPFNAYALAMEYRNTDPTKAMKYFDELLEKHPSYLATYYQAAQLAFENANIDKAHKLYALGIELATHQQQHKTLKELRGALQLMLDELED